MTTYVLVSSAGIVEGTPFTPQPGMLITDAFPDLAMNWVDVTSLTAPPLPGSTYANGTFTAPPAPPAPAAPATILPLEFMGRLTPAEQTAIETASQSNAQVRLYLDKLAAASYVDVTDPVTAGGLQAMEAAGLLSAGRAAQVLDLAVASP